MLIVPGGVGVAVGVGVGAAGATANKKPVDTLLFRLVHVFVPVLPDAVSCWSKISKTAEDSKVIPLIAAVPENPP